MNIPNNTAIDESIVVRLAQGHQGKVAEGGYIEVTLYGDGSAAVHLYGVLCGSRDVTGNIRLDSTGTVKANNVEDSFSSAELSTHVRGVAENRARIAARKARTRARDIIGAHLTG